MTTAPPQEPPAPRRAPPSEYRAIHRLESGFPAAVQVRERFAGGRAAVAVPAEGYEFPWGVVVESLAGMALVFDFHLEGLQAAYEQKSRPAAALQERAFALLEETAAPARRASAAAWNPLAWGAWVFVPGTLGKAAAFTALCRVGDEAEFRQWLIAEFLLDTLPELIQRLHDELEPEA